MILKKTMLILSLLAIGSTSLAVTKEECADLLTKEFQNETVSNYRS